jgi:prepilin peptidase CpaA
MLLISADLLKLTVAGLLSLAALHDIATRTVPNWVSVAILIAGFALQAIVGTLLIACGLSVAVFVLAEVIRRLGWLGGADVKLLGASTMAVSPGSVGSLLIAVSLAGGVLAILYLALFQLGRRPAPGSRKGLVPRFLKAEGWRIHKRGPLPYATAIAVGGLITIYSS